MILYFFIIFILSITQIYSQNLKTNNIKSVFFLNNEDTLKDYIQIPSIPNSYINWTKGIIRTEYSILADNNSANIGRELNTYIKEIRNELKYNLLKIIGEIKVKDIYTIQDLIENFPDIKYEIENLIEKAFYYPIVKKGKYYSGTAEILLFGTNGLANIFYEKIDRIELKTFTNFKYQDLEYFDTLVIDTTQNPEFNPSIELRIYDTNKNLLFGPETINKTNLINNGGVLYVASLKSAFLSNRAKKRIYFTLPYKISGNANNEIILHDEDVKRLFSNPRTIDLINNSAIIVVVNNGQ